MGKIDLNYALLCFASKQKLLKGSEVEAKISEKKRKKRSEIL